MTSTSCFETGNKTRQGLARILRSRASNCTCRNSTFPTRRGRVHCVLACRCERRRLKIPSSLGASFPCRGEMGPFHTMLPCSSSSSCNACCKSCGVNLVSTILMRDGPSPKNPKTQQAKQFNGSCIKRAESARNVLSKTLNHLAAAKRKTMPICVNIEIKMISSYVFQKPSTQRMSSWTKVSGDDGGGVVSGC